MSLPPAAPRAASGRAGLGAAARVLAMLLGVGVLAALALVVTPLPELFGRQVLVVQGGSMEPTIPLGSIIVIEPVKAAELRVGDVITFADQNHPDLLITHRIVEMEARGGEVVATTQGDANNATDAWSVPLTRTLGRVTLHVPGVGYLVAWLSTPQVKAGALGLAALLFVLPKRRPAARGGQRASDSPAEEFDALADEIEALLGERGAKRRAAGR